MHMIGMTIVDTWGGNRTLHGLRHQWSVVRVRRRSSSTAKRRQESHAIGKESIH